MKRAPGTGQRASAAAGGRLRDDRNSWPPAYTFDVGVSPFAATSVAIGTPVRAEIFDNVSPGCTMTIDGLAVIRVDALGSVRTWPILIRLGLPIPLAEAMACTVVPLRAAMPARVSPER